MPEVAESHLNTLVAAKQLLDGIYADPEFGDSVKRAVRKARPDLVIPELQAQDAIAPFAAKVDEAMAKFGELTTRMDTEAQERRDAAAADKLARAMATARDRHSLTDEGVEGMLTLMREKGISDPHDAAELYTARLPKPKLATSQTGRYGSTVFADVTGMADQKEREDLLLSNPDRFFVEEVERCMEEFERTGEIA